MTYKLFLDDLREPPSDDWVVARSYHAAVDIIHERGWPSFVSFDHDLGNTNGYPDLTGKDFADFLIVRDMDQGDMPADFAYQVHSANPIGAENIRGALEGYLKQRA